MLYDLKGCVIKENMILESRVKTDQEPAITEFEKRYNRGISRVSCYPAKTDISSAWEVSSVKAETSRMKWPFG